MALQRSVGLRDIASATEVGSFTPTLDDLGRRARTFEGLGFQTAWFWAGVTTPDGQRYALLRQHEPGSTYLFFGLEIADDVWSDPGVRYATIPGHDDLYGGSLKYEEKDGAQVIKPGNPLYREMSLSLKPGEYRWIEADWLDLTMVPLGEALRYACPGPPDSFGYTSQICRVKGTVDGKAAEGFGGLDRYYGEHGVVWGQSKGFRHLEELWWVWAGIGEDGRQEHGVAITGPGEFRVGFFHRDGEAVLTTNEVEHEVEWEERDGRRLPLKATIEFGGRRFLYRPSGNVTIPGADLFIDWLHGEMAEDGGPPLAQRFSWLEYFKHLAKPSG
jgi:hypothetical protein